MTENKHMNHLVEIIWLSYFNQFLYDKGIITETEKNKMTLKITSQSREAPRTQK